MGGAKAVLSSSRPEPEAEILPRAGSTAIAATDCQVVPIDEEKFTYLVRQTPYFALDVLRVMARRLRHSTQEIAAMSGTIKV